MAISGCASNSPCGELGKKFVIPTKTQLAAEASLLQSARPHSSFPNAILGHSGLLRIFQPEPSCSIVKGKLENILFCFCVHARLLSHVQQFVTPMDSSPPGSSVHGDSPSKNTGVSCYALLRKIFLPRPGIEPRSALWAESLSSEPARKPCFCVNYINYTKVR